MLKEIVVYSRSFGCPYVSAAKQVLDRYSLPYREILINKVPEARRRVVEWTGFESVPTIIAAVEGQDLPCEPPAPLPAGASPRGINRGSMITEPSAAQLEEWLRQHAFIR
jgi:glutaredoxin